MKVRKVLVSDDDKPLEVLRSLKNSGKLPSEVNDSYWITASSNKPHPRSTIHVGKWLIFVDKKEIDGVWRKIRNATENGVLGSNSKVSTMRPNPNSTDSSKGVICVYTYDWQDEDDAMRIREELRKLGITEKIPYKSDIDTFSGKYKVKGDTKISKYYC